MNIKIANDKEFFYQWDTGQLLEITDDGRGSEVHLEKDDLTLACAIREENGVRLVDVPDLLLQGDGYLTAYLVCKVEDEVETLFSRTFRIEHRAKPEDYVCTETEILRYRDLAERITALEQNGGSTGGGIAQETDPTVQSWAKTPLTAEVGQFFKVSAVENGKVTAVEAVDAPKGGDAWEIIKEISIAEEVSYVEETFAKTYRRFLMRINSPNLSTDRTLVFVFNGRNSNTFQNKAMGSNKRTWTGEIEITDVFIKAHSGVAGYYDSTTNIQPFEGNNYGQLLARNKDVNALLNAGDEGVYSVQITAKTTAFLAGDSITFFGVPI